MNRVSLFITGIALVLFTPAPCLAATKKIGAEGYSEISYEAALQDAKRAAVEQGVGTFIHSEIEMTNFFVQKDKIFTRAEGYLTGYDILEKRQEDHLYYVKIEAKVSMDKVKDDLVAMNILLESMDRPKLMILIEEEDSGTGLAGMKVAETEMISLLEKKGFDLIDKAGFDAADRQEQERRIFAGDMDAAKAMGLRFGAQYLIIGKSVVQNSETPLADKDFHSLLATLQIRILNCRSGSILGSTVMNAAKAHINKLSGATAALRAVSRKAVDTYISDKITKSFQDFLNNGMPLKLHVVGVRSFQEYKDLISFLEKVNGVVRCKKEGWNKTSGLLTLDMRYKGRSEELAELLDRKTVGNGKLGVEDFTPEKLDLVYRSNSTI